MFLFIGSVLCYVVAKQGTPETAAASISQMTLWRFVTGLGMGGVTPLATTLTCSEAILDQIPAEAGATLSPETIEAIRDGASVIREQVMRCRTITDQFLRFARGIPPATEPIDLRHVVSSVLSLARPTARAAGVKQVLLAGQEKAVADLPAESRPDGYLNAKLDAVEALSSLLTRLGA